jgi:O-antigen/teichoic acid export membrane protein
MISRNFLTLLSGGALAQVITIAALPLLARFYDPTDFGQLGAIMAVVSLATVLVHGRYQMAIPVAQSEDDAQNLLVFSILISALLSLPAVAAIFFLFDARPDDLSLWEFLLASTVITFFSAVIDILSYWRSHRGRFGVSARNSVARSAFTVLTQIGLAPVSTAGLLLGTGFGVGMAITLALRDIVRNDLFQLRMPSMCNLREIAYKYRNYPLFGVPQGWLAAISWNAMPLLLLRHGGISVAGQYWIAYRLLVAPVSLFNGMYRQAILPLLRGRSVSEGRTLVARHSMLIAGASCLPLLTLFFFGEIIFTFLMGPSWQQAGAISGWMAIGIFGDLIKVPTLCFLQRHSRQQRILIWEIVIVITRYAFALPFLLIGEIMQAIAIFSSLGLAGWLAFTLSQLLASYKFLNLNE